MIALLGDRFMSKTTRKNYWGFLFRNGTHDTVFPVFSVSVHKYDRGDVSCDMRAGVEIAVFGLWMFFGRVYAPDEN